MEVKRHIPRKVCTPDKVKRLKELGYKTSGYYPRLEEILDKLNYANPYRKVLNDDDYFGFCIDGIQWYTMNYADACADKIIFIHEKNKFRDFRDF